MVIENYMTVRDCPECFQRISPKKQKRPLKLFLPSDRLEFIAMDILLPLPNTLEANLFVWLMSERYRKLKRAVLKNNMPASRIASLFMHYCVVTYGTLTDVLTDNQPQIIFKLLKLLNTYFGTEPLIITSYRLQTSWYPEVSTK